MEDFQFSKSVTVFHGRAVPEEGYLAGYSAIIDVFGIQIPLPNKLVLISSKNRTYEKQSWRVFPFRYLPENNLYKHLVFAIKYEGLNLLFFKKLFEIIDNKEIISLVKAEPNGQYARRIWFLFEWLTGVNLPIPDLEKGNYVELLDEKIQFSIGSGIKSQRHRVTNNLPGTREFCPLVFKTKKLENYIDKRLSAQTEHIIQGVRKDFLQRAAAFLLLKDSKASFSIEGESPKSKRAARWGQALGQAGMKSLSKEELYRLQQLVIENPRFMVLGYRQKGGFVGEHDRVSGEPLPDHISAKWEDIEFLMEGLLDTEKILIDESFDPVVAATVIAFGMVNIHPFEDGNGRIHRYLIHHVLAKKKFAPQGIIFPVSAAILDRINDYRTVLESYSLPLLDFIEWKETKDHNVEVLNQTIDFYRYYDLTLHAEFLYECVDETIEKIIPAEIEYLAKYDEFKNYIEEEFEMPDKLVSILVRFLEQNSGKLSKRARENEFVLLHDEEIEAIENTFKSVFNPRN
ncbi:MAG: Fic family protein [Algoriphagus sp.]|uniref:Fic family protein n=1 Tax=Algoriphagus sp. TaxID=1872435 RepID=UPI00329A008E